MMLAVKIQASSRQIILLMFTILIWIPEWVSPTKMEIKGAYIWKFLRKDPQWKRILVLKAMFGCVTLKQVVAQRTSSQSPVDTWVLRKIVKSKVCIIIINVDEKKWETETWKAMYVKGKVLVKSSTMEVENIILPGNNLFWLDGPEVREDKLLTNVHADVPKCLHGHNKPQYRQ